MAFFNLKNLATLPEIRIDFSFSYLRFGFRFFFFIPQNLLVICTNTHFYRYLCASFCGHPFAIYSQSNYEQAVRQLLHAHIIGSHNVYKLRKWNNKMCSIVNLYFFFSVFLLGALLLSLLALFAAALFSLQRAKNFFSPHIFSWERLCTYCQPGFYCSTLWVSSESTRQYCKYNGDTPLHQRDQHDKD